jgi:Flp pilus assembly pilin Flp
MVQILWLVRDKVLSFLRDTRAQDTFEYVLIIGGITVAVIAAVAIAAPTLMDGVLGGVCTAINGVDGAGGINIDCTPWTG